jgi:hypothetical protein
LQGSGYEAFIINANAEERQRSLYLPIRKFIKSLLFIFVVVSLGVLIYKEFFLKSVSNATDLTKAKAVSVAASGEAVPPENQPLKEPAAKLQEKASLPQSEVKAKNTKVIAYYFHGTYRCTTCQTIEKYSKEAIELYFSSELAAGTLVFKPLNVEEPENRHYIQDYQLFSKSLVISLVKQDMSGIRIGSFNM